MQHSTPKDITLQIPSVIFATSSRANEEGRLLSFRMNNVQSSSAVSQYFCMIMLWTVTVDSRLSYWNVALRKPAYQISTNCSDVANKATDGEEFVKVNYKTCSRTNGHEWTWWMVDLLGVYRVEQVRISNIGDYRSDWLANFSIDVSIKDPREAPGFPRKLGNVCHLHTGARVATSGINVNCLNATLGRFVRIVKHNNQALVLCEVIVWTKTLLEQYSFYKQMLDPVARLQEPLKRGSTPSKITCAAWCTKRREKDNCRGFSWSPSERMCYLFAPEPLNSSIQGYLPGGGLLYVGDSQGKEEELSEC